MFDFLFLRRLRGGIVSSKQHGLNYISDSVKYEMTGALVHHYLCLMLFCYYTTDNEQI